MFNIQNLSALSIVFVDCLLSTNHNQFQECIELTVRTNLCLLGNRNSERKGKRCTCAQIIRGRKALSIYLVIYFIHLLIVLNKDDYCILYIKCLVYDYHCCYLDQHNMMFCQKVKPQEGAVRT